MSKLLLIISLFLSSALVYGQAEFSFDKTTIKLPKTKAGEVVKFQYTFTNTGNQPLIISDIKVACGCTVPTYPKQPLKPGEKATIHVSFDTAGKIGYQDRTLEVFANVPKSPVKLRFKIVVENPKK